MPLKDFSDQYPSLTARLRQARLQNRIAHAYLFVSDMGSRMEEFANAFLQLCVCNQPTGDGDACGTCSNCITVAKGSYPYLTELRPRSKMRQIRIDEVRDLEHMLHLTSAGETRLAVIHDADRMNEKAQNAFLKTLEEPSPRTVIVLVTSSPRNLLPTIRSRCQLIAMYDNKIDYGEFMETDLFSVLATMQPGAGALKAAKASQMIRETLQEIKAGFKGEAEAAMRAFKSENSELEPPALKKKQEEIDAQVESLYRGERIKYLSALHAWFSQELIRSEDVSETFLPHPELFEVVDPLPAPANPRDARLALDLVEELMRSLQFNTDEALAIENFCQSVCAKA